MKKFLKGIMILLVVMCLAGCADQNVEENNEFTVDVTNQLNDVVLYYNTFGISFYSALQSDRYNITYLFNDNLPKAGDSVTFCWKGKSNRDIKKLHMLVADISETGDWTHLISESKKIKPIATDIKAGEEFEIKETIKLDESALSTVNVYFCCGVEDTDGPLHLYTTATENTERYNEYMKSLKSLDMNSDVKVEQKGVIEFNKANKTISFKEFPIIKFADGTSINGSTDEGKTALLDNGYFYIHFWGDDFREDFLKATGNVKKNTCLHGGVWGGGGIDESFKDYNISDKFTKETIDGEIYGECSYFALADENKSPLFEDDEKKICYYYFPIVAFDVVMK